MGRKLPMPSIRLTEVRAARRRSARGPITAVGLALAAPSCAVAGDMDELAELRRMVLELKAQNRELSRRLGALESKKATPEARQARPAEKSEPPTSARYAGGAAERLPAPGPRQDMSRSLSPASPAPTADHLIPAPATWQARGADLPTKAQERPVSDTAASPVPTFAAAPRTTMSPPLPEPHDTTGLPLDERVRELELGWAAQEHATRQIIRDSLSTIGPNINNVLALSGVVEFLGTRFREFDGTTRELLNLSTVELDYDIRMSEWLKGALVLSYETGTGLLFPTTSPLLGPGVDRFLVDRTHITIGDIYQFPVVARFAREVVPFGTSTGVARLDTLSLVTPLTTEVFENKQTVAGFEFGFPTPPLQPPPPPVIVPPVQPLVVAPFVRTLAQALGYAPPPRRVARLAPQTPIPRLPPFYGSFLVYRGSDNIRPDRTRIQDYAASVGFQTESNCGVPYEELRSSLVCPLAIDTHVDYSSSVFDSIFLERAYAPFSVGTIPGMAASIKARLGPFALVGEYNTALGSANFVDAGGTPRSITPSTWQASISYQFDWNPWVTEIGAQGNFISVAYSQSNGLAGVTDLINGVPTRVGFLPRKRLSVTAGEWPMDALKMSVEYSVDWDYPLAAGGTGNIARGIFGQVQLNF